MRRHSPGPAPAIFLLMVLALAYLASQCQAQPAHGQTSGLRPVLWLPVIGQTQPQLISNCDALYPESCEMFVGDVPAGEVR